MRGLFGILLFVLFVLLTVVVVVGTSAELSSVCLCLILLYIRFLSRILDLRRLYSNFVARMYNYLLFVVFCADFGTLSVGFFVFAYTVVLSESWSVRQVLIICCLFLRVGSS